MYKNLREYITALEQAGELVRITAPVDSQLEICELTDRESKRSGGGRALLFEQTGTPFSRGGFRGCQSQRETENCDMRASRHHGQYRQFFDFFLLKHYLRRRVQLKLKP